MQIRQMTKDDLDFAAECTSGAGWNTETRIELSAIYHYNPSGCFIGDEDGRSVAVCMATSFGEAGFIGELIVDPAWRGRGFGAAMMTQAIKYLEESDVQAIYLDGVSSAVPLYERLGFRRICRSLRFGGQGGRIQGESIRPMSFNDLKRVNEIDVNVFGLNRSFFLRHRLEKYGDLCFVQEKTNVISGYIQGRRGNNVISVGPWVSESGANDSLPLLNTVAERAGSTPLRIGILEDNHTAVASVRSLGFAESSDPPWRMVYGEGENPGSHRSALAIGSPAKG